MASLTLRSEKGSPLTNSEVDGNFTALNTELGTKLASASYTAADVLTKIKTVDGAGSGLDADLLDGLTSASTNTVSTIVARDASGNFAAGTITANVSGNASGLSATLAIASGGTGATTASAARTSLGVAIGTNVQEYSTNLAAISSVAANGFYSRTAPGTASTRTITGTTGYITVSNGDGVADNPTLTVGANVAKLDVDAAWATTASIKLPVGTTAQRDATPVAGRIRFNSTLTQFEGHNGSAWAVLGPTGGGGGNYAFFENDVAITSNYSITPGKNAMTAGPITINNGITVTVPDGSVWTIV